MTSPPRDTIYALSSGRLPAAIAVVRISGPRAGDALKALAGRIPEPRKGAFARVRDPDTREPIDDALALWFPGPNSETGEDTAELQLHGGRAVLAATFAALGRIEGCRPAEAGEFTRRAFENGKIDLTTVEGLADLVAAETEGQRRQALRQMQGALRTRAESWRERLVKALALVEAGIDFSDEGDVPEDLTAPARAIAGELEAEIAAALRDAARGERLREGLVVAIAGPPNAGKSTLLNRLAQREVAIVSPHAGTTRDVIEVHLDLDGWPVTLLDTAGIRETADPVEMEGVRRASERAAAADLVLWVVDATRPLDEQVAGLAWGSDPCHATPAPTVMAGTSQASTFPISRVPADTFATPTASAPPVPAAAPSSADPPSTAAVPAVSVTPAALPGASASPAPGPAASALVWLAANKTDLLTSAGLGRENVNSVFYNKNELKLQTFEHRFTLSAMNGEGVDSLSSALTDAATRLIGASDPALVTRERQRLALEQTRSALARAAGGLAAEDLIAEELRLAARALARLTGRVDVEDVLDVIFRDFCVGK